MPSRLLHRLAIITIITMFSGGTEQDTGLLLPASLALSLLSMAYGFFGIVQLSAKAKLSNACGLEHSIGIS